jgi:hypothetical protein
MKSALLVPLAFVTSLCIQAQDPSCDVYLNVLGLQVGGSVAYDLELRGSLNTLLPTNFPLYL